MADNQDLINALAGNVADERARDPAWRNTLMQRYAPDFSGMPTLADFLRQVPLALMGMRPGAAMPTSGGLRFGDFQTARQMAGPRPAYGHTATQNLKNAIVDGYEPITPEPLNPYDAAAMLQSLKPANQNQGQAVGAPRPTGKYGSLPEEAQFRRLMGQQYEIARQSGDLSTMHDILGGRLINDRNMPPAMRQQMELERLRIAHEMGPEGRRMAGIPDPSIVEGQ